MPLTARWREPGFGRNGRLAPKLTEDRRVLGAFEAFCARRGCGAQLGIWEEIEDGDGVLGMHSGLIFNERAGYGDISARAAKLWKKARAAGTPWSLFVPEARHTKKETANPDKMPTLRASPPTAAKCPLCGYMNFINLTTLPREKVKRIPPEFTRALSGLSGTTIVTRTGVFDEGGKGSNTPLDIAQALWQYLAE